jgi:polyisoprenoid-binding protein YceI
VNKLVAPLVLAATVALADVAPARASHFSAHAGSSLQFTAAYQGESFTGRFTRFEAAIRFDPKNLAGSRLDVRIPLASARTDNAERDEMLVGPEFFDAGAMPEARYEATRVVKLKDGRYRADGTLTLRGVSRPVPLLFTWTEGAMPTLTGEAVVNRLDFGVGTGDWEDLELIPNRVKISTRLVLGPQARVKVPEAATK